MTKNLKPAATDFFWELAAPLLSSGEVHEGSLMDFAYGQAYAQYDTITPPELYAVSRANRDRRVQSGDS
jgi:hypothetical protein